jgi:hypothetical protein
MTEKDLLEYGLAADILILARLLEARQKGYVRNGKPSVGPRPDYVR